MKTAIAPAKQATKLVVPKPSQTQIIEAMAHVLIQKRQIENKIREEKRKALQSKLDKEFEKLQSKRIPIRQLGAQLDSDGDVHVRHAKIPGTAKMKELAKEIRQLEGLPTYPAHVIDEIKAQMKKETISVLTDQPGFKDAVESAFAKLNITA